MSRADIHHESAPTTGRRSCGLKRIGGDISEKLDYSPEQPRKVHPEYVGYGGAGYTNMKLIGTSTTHKDVKRMYYKSIGENRLFAEGRLWMVRSVSAQGNLIGEAWTDDQAKAWSTSRPWRSCSAGPVLSDVRVTRCPLK